MIMRALILSLIALLITGCAATTGSSRNADSGPVAEAAMVNVRLAVAYLQSGRFEVAQEKIERALEISPNLATAHNVAGVLYEQLDQEALASRHYRRAAELAPADGEIQNTYGTYLCKKGEYALAETHFLRALRDPFYSTPAVALTNAGKCVNRIPERATEYAYFERAIEQDPDYADALFAMAQAMYSDDQSFRARAFLQRVESVSPVSPQILYLGYQIESALNNDRNMREYADQLMSKFPESEPARQLRQQSTYD